MRRLITVLLIISVLSLSVSAVEISLFTQHSQVQEFIDGELTENAGISSEWFVFALHHGNYDFSKYVSALDAYVEENSVSDVTMLKYALSYLACGEPASKIADITSGIQSGKGIMYSVFALHLANNGAVLQGTSTAALCEHILSLQNDDGGWSVTRGASDVDVTAMALQALAPHESEYGAEIKCGISLLEKRQNENGTYSSYGVENAESTSQVIIALCDLGIDLKSDSRFIKNGADLFDAISLFKTDNGYSHTAGGAYGALASSQVMCAFSAYENDGYFYVFEEKSDNAPQQSDNAPQQSENTESADVDGDADIIPQTDAASDAPSDKDTFGVPLWQMIYIIAICLLCVAVCCYFIVTKRRRAHNFIIVILCSAVLIAISFIVNVSTPEEYYGQNEQDGEQIGRVTVSIECSVSENGDILPRTSVALYDGQSVYELLISLSKTYKFTVDASGSDDFAYIRGINGISELAYGDLSGWVFTVNGISPSVSCGSYIPSDGDDIKIYYTTDGVPRA